MRLATDQQLDLGKLSSTSRKMIEPRETVLAGWEKRVRKAFKQAKALIYPIIIDSIPSFTTISSKP